VTQTWTMTDIESLAQYAPRDLETAAAMHGVLQQHYPGHTWATSADHATGMANVRLLYLDTLGVNARYGFQLHIAQLKSDPTMRAVIRAGGELLERFRLRRGPANDDTPLLAREHGLDKTR
jgi:hypothetical protein